MRKRLRNIFDKYHQPENHLTNSLLLVLNHNRNLLKAILKANNIALPGKHINLLSQVAPRSVKDKTSIPDAYIYTEDYNFCIGIETKIVENNLREEQLISHLEQLSEYDQSILLVLTPDKIEPSIIGELNNKYSNLIFISWISLLELMTTIGPDKGKNEIGYFLFEEFMAYIERNYHMTPFTGFNFRDGYDSDLAVHYVKRISEIITPKIMKLYPMCVNKRPRIIGKNSFPWEAWYSSEKSQDSVHPGISVQNDKIRCCIVISNGCKKEWKNFSNILQSESLSKKLLNHLKKTLDKAPKGADTIISFRQRHYPNRVTPVIDAMTVINVATLIGINGAKKNPVWWNLIRDIASSKNRFNYQLEIGYEMKYEKVKELKDSKAPDLIVKCFQTLKPIYEMLNNY